MPTRNASATWEGGLKDGKGSYRGESGTAGAFGFSSRFENGAGSNPEELLAAAHAACYSMALSVGLEKAGKKGTRVETKAACTIEKVNDQQTITKMVLTVRASVPGMDAAEFAKLADATKLGCPVSACPQRWQHEDRARRQTLLVGVKTQTLRQRVKIRTYFAFSCYDLP